MFDALEFPSITSSGIVTQELLKRKARDYDPTTDVAMEGMYNKIQAEDASVFHDICAAGLAFCHAETVGISILSLKNTKPIFNWAVVAGHTLLDGIVCSPRDDTPCGTVLDLYSYQLFSHPEKHYQWVREQGLEIPEMITMPIYKDNMEPLGTLWLMHRHGTHFDGLDIRIISLLASLIKLAIKSNKLHDQLTTVNAVDTKA